MKIHDDVSASARLRPAPWLKGSWMGVLAFSLHPSVSKLPAGALGASDAKKLSLSSDVSAVNGSAQGSWVICHFLLKP